MPVWKYTQQSWCFRCETTALVLQIAFIISCWLLCFSSVKPAHTPGHPAAWHFLLTPIQGFSRQPAEITPHHLWSHTLPKGGSYQTYKLRAPMCAGVPPPRFFPEAREPRKLPLFLHSLLISCWNDAVRRDAALQEERCNSWVLSLGIQTFENCGGQLNPKPGKSQDGQRIQELARHSWQDAAGTSATLSCFHHPDTAAGGHGAACARLVLSTALQGAQQHHSLTTAQGMEQLEGWKSKTTI